MIQKDVMVKMTVAPHLINVILEKAIVIQIQIVWKIYFVAGTIVLETHLK